jgi:hypothetical protein
MGFWVEVLTDLSHRQTSRKKPVTEKEELLKFFAGKVQKRE